MLLNSKNLGNVGSASRLYLPKLQSPPSTILEYLFACFSRMGPDIWRERVARGSIKLSDGTTVTLDSPYRHGVFVFYRKEVPSEPNLLEEPLIVYRDDDILVVDKPHGMPVTPVGEYVERSLLVCLQRTTGLDTLAPMHRLDLDTAGLLLLTAAADIRGQYHRLFAEGLVEREYRAIAHVKDAPNCLRWCVKNRLGQGDPWFRRAIVEGPPNAITEIELLMLEAGTGSFRLVPKTGKKHQLRLHMALLGFPIVGDCYYPELRERRDGGSPLQLLASRLAFVDPRSGEYRTFNSRRCLTI